MQRNGISLYYEEHGEGAPLLLGHSLTLDGSMYAPAIPHLAKKYRVLNVDFRGHGRSSKPDEPYTLQSMAEDLYSLLEALGIQKTYYAGLSMGGMVGMRLALSHPEKLEALVLLDTSAGAEKRRQEFETIAEAMRKSGPSRAVSEFVVNLLLSPTYQREHPEVVSQLVEKLLQADIVGQYRASLAVIQREDILPKLPSIRLPTLVIVGEEDAATPRAEAEAIASHIPSAELTVIPQAGHLSIFEKPLEVVQKIFSFLQKHPLKVRGA